MRQTSKSTHKTLHQTGGDFSSSPGILSMSQLLQSANAKSVNKSTAPQMMIPRGIEARKKVMSHQMAISHSCRFMEMPAHKVVMVGMTKRLTNCRYTNEGNNETCDYKNKANECYYTLAKELSPS